MNTTISNTAISEEQLARASTISTEIRKQISSPGNPESRTGCASWRWGLSVRSDLLG